MQSQILLGVRFRSDDCQTPTAAAPPVNPRSFRDHNHKCVIGMLFEPLPTKRSFARLNRRLFSVCLAPIPTCNTDRHFREYLPFAVSIIAEEPANRQQKANRVPSVTKCCDDARANPVASVDSGCGLDQSNNRSPGRSLFLPWFGHGR